jgi:hypothetical protein
VKLILDTNSLLLFLVGSASPAYIEKHSRTDKFSQNNFVLLVEIIETFDFAFTIPQVLAETSNLLSKPGGNYNTMSSNIWSVYEDFVNITEEMTINSASILNDVAFRRLGLTDAILTAISDGNHQVLTSDAGLYNEIVSRGYQAINLWHEIESVEA